MQPSQSKILVRDDIDYLGILLGTIAFALLTCVDTIFKLLMNGSHFAYELLFINGCFALVPILIWLFITNDFRALRTSQLPQHFARGVMGIMSALAAMYAYTRLPLADFYTIIFAGPLVATALSVLWLQEEVELTTWLAIIVGFGGVLIAFSPSLISRAPNTLYLSYFSALISMLCYAISVTMVRFMRRGESNVSFSFYSYTTAICLCAFALIFNSRHEFLWHDFVLLMISGSLSGVASLCLMTAYHRAKVMLIAPFQYSQILWGIIAGYVLWAELPGVHMIASALMVTGSGIIVLWRIHRNLRAVP